MKRKIKWIISLSLIAGILCFLYFLLPYPRKVWMIAHYLKSFPTRAYSVSHWGIIQNDSSETDILSLECHIYRNDEILETVLELKKTQKHIQLTMPSCIIIQRSLFILKLMLPIWIMFSQQVETTQRTLCYLVMECFTTVSFIHLKRFATHQNLYRQSLLVHQILIIGTSIILHWIIRLNQKCCIQKI